MKGSWDVFLFNTEKSTKGAVLTEKGYKLRETNDEGRMTNDELYRQGTLAKLIALIIIYF